MSPGLETCRDYLLTVQQATDEISQRKKREQILRDLLQSLFEKKDHQRLFSPEQRRIIWNSSTERKCRKCGKPITWNDFTVDHIKPHSKGGRTKLDNAAIMHRSCNASKGNRTK
ncbi:HNH endonuclease [bacterium]|nr:HNH endonuclease [bacterium]